MKPHDQKRFDILKAIYELSEPRGGMVTRPVTYRRIAEKLGRVEGAIRRSCVLLKKKGFVDFDKGFGATLRLGWDGREALKIGDMNFTVVWIYYCHECRQSFWKKIPATHAHVHLKVQTYRPDTDCFPEFDDYIYLDPLFYVTFKGTPPNDIIDFHVQEIPKGEFQKELRGQRRIKLAKAQRQNY